jgi:hypothetical protein
MHPVVARRRLIRARHRQQSAFIIQLSYKRNTGRRSTVRETHRNDSARMSCQVRQEQLIAPE